MENIQWVRDTQNYKVLSILHYLWLKIGQRPTTMVNESKFCDPKTLSQILNAKSKLDKIDRDTFMKARST